jgi:hypothetical protein
MSSWKSVVVHRAQIVAVHSFPTLWRNVRDDQVSESWNLDEALQPFARYMLEPRQ